MYRLLQFLCWIAAAIPLSAALAFGRGLGLLASLLVRRHRATIVAEMQRCYPRETRAGLRRRLRRVYQHVGMNYMEVLRWIGGKADELDHRIALQGSEHLDAVLAGGRGALVLTAHIGNWDLMGLWAARRYPLTIISKHLRQPGVNRFWMEARSASGLEIVPARKSYRACLGVLKKNGLLGFILDQNALRMEGVFVEFFGKPACTTPGLAFLSAHAGSPVVPVFMYRQPDGRHLVRVEAPLEPPPDRENSTLVAATQCYTRIIEDAIRAHPDQWIWMHRRWRTVPEPVEQTEASRGPNAMEKST